MPNDANSLGLFEPSGVALNIAWRALPGRLAVFAILLVSSCSRKGAPTSAESQPHVSSTTATDRSIDHMVGVPDTGLFPEMPVPEYVSQLEARSFVTDEDEVFLVRFGSHALVVPAPLIGAHHVINTVLDGKAAAVTACVLTGSSSVYSREVDGQALTFGVLGTLYFGNVVLYDKETRSYWLQLTGECFHGRLKGKRLQVMAVMQPAQWKAVQGIAVTGVMKPLSNMTAYRTTYAEMKAGNLGLEIARNTVNLDPRLQPREPGLGITVGAAARFYPEDRIDRLSPWNDGMGGSSLLILHDTALGSRKIFSRRKEDGTVLTFELQGAVLADQETGSKWSFDGEARDGPLKGKRLEAPAYTPVFWFSWSAFYPGTDIGVAHGQ